MPKTTKDLSSDQHETFDAEGGEWELLVTNVRNWLQKNQFINSPEKIFQNFLLIIGLLAAVLSLQIFSQILKVIALIPLFPKSLELLGLIRIVLFSTTHLVRETDRQELLSSLKKRWQAFLGKAKRAS